MPQGGAGFPFGNIHDIFERIFEQDPSFNQFFNRVMVAEPIRITFMVCVWGGGPQAGGGGHGKD